jgi:photosystem II stability/assembly factor-like uncharacterized protein
MATRRDPTVFYERRPEDRIDYGHRHRGLELRTEWFHLDRPYDDRELERIFHSAYRHKREMIERQREAALEMAAYNPAGAGTPWFSIGPRNINGRVKSLAVHPTNAAIIYAGAASGGVWKSEDGAQSWRPLWDEQETLVIGSLALAPGAPDTIYVGTGEWTPGYGAAGPGEGVYASTDGGASWARRAAVLARRIARVVVSQDNANTVYVAGDRGFERSTNGGVTWTTVRAGEISDAVIDPNDADTIYVNVRNDGIYKTTDAGANWTRLTNGPTGASADWIKLAIGDNGTNGSNFVLAKRSGTIYRSTDGGTTWTTLGGSHGDAPHHTWANLVAVAPDDEGIIIAGGVGCQRTANGGTSWSTLSELHADHHVAQFAPSDTNRVYTCNDGGVYRSDDKGATWKKASHGLVVTQFYDVDSWDPISTVVGGGTQDQGTTMSLGGLTWRHIQNTHDGGYFLISPTDPRTIWEEHQYTDIYRSTDGGANWVQRTGGLTDGTPWVGVLAMHPTNHNILYTGTTRVFRTTDGVATNWVASSQILVGEVSSIAIARSDPNRVYAAAGSRVYSTSDAGATSPWADRTTATLPTARPLKDIAVDRNDEDRVLLGYGGTTGGAANHVFLSTNGGTSWTAASGNLPDISVNAVAFDPNAANTFYAGTDVGVYRTTDGGANWQAFDNGMPNVIVTDMTVDAEDNMLYAATFGRGMYKVGIAAGASEPAVDLYLRDSVLDTGERIPSPIGQANPADTTDVVEWWESPDIKVEVAPYYTPDAVFDGVEFDEEVVHDDPQRGRTNRFYLQVHNRGWQDATNLRVRAFFADAHAGLPSLPNALTPPDFNLTSTADWAPIGPAQDIARLEPNRPVIRSWDWAVPTTANTHSCLLAVVSAVSDPITTTETNVNILVTNEKRVCLKNLHVVNASGPQPSLVPLKFHNPSSAAALIDIIVFAEAMRDGILGLLLGQIELEDPEKAFVGVELILLREGEHIGKWYVRRGSRGDVEVDEVMRQLDRSVLYAPDIAKRSEIRGIKLGPKETLQALFACRPTRKLPYGTVQRFTAMQRQDGEIIGGSTFELRPSRARGLHPVSHLRVILEKVGVAFDHDPWLKGRGEFSFATSVMFNDDDCRRHTVRVPRHGEVKIGDKPPPAEHTFDVCIFDGYVAEGESMTLEIAPTEHDWLDPDDELMRYRRDFTSPPEDWVGSYTPDDEPGGDVERLSDWMVWYRIESLRLGGTA